MKYHYITTSNYVTFNNIYLHALRAGTARNFVMRLSMWNTRVAGTCTCGDPLYPPHLHNVKILIKCIVVSMLSIGYICNKYSVSDTRM